ncbi:MAG TPA: hypothetical protein VN684_12855 [Terriglobales bacterium]|nr:hypothetical protein [Terriglobales bacterium]
MLIPSRMQTLFALAIFVAIPFRLAGDPREKPQKYEKEVFFGLTQIQTNDGCVNMTVAVSAGDFFWHLQKIQNGDAVEFRKGSQVVTAFPENISVTLQVSDPGLGIDMYCRGKSAIQMKTIGDFALMKSLQFKAFWERNSQIRDAVELSVQGHSSLIYRIYVLSIQSRDVPLTDHLILSVFDGAGNKVATFSLAL